MALVLLTGANIFAQGSPVARPFLHGVFGDNMVLQRDALCPVWGWTAPGSRISVGIAGKTASAIAAADGKWMVRIGPLAAGGPFELKVSGPETVTLKNVMIGDVWLCSGQSNMQMGVKGISRWWQEQGDAEYPAVRLAFIPFASAFTPPNSIETSWRASSRETVFSDQPVFGGFSAIAFLFGRRIHKETNIPIGLIEACWGSTDVAAWSTPDSVKSLPYAGGADRFGAFRSEVEKAWQAMDPAYETTKSWSAAGFSDADWNEQPLSSNGSSDAVRWYRKKIEVPASWAGRELLVSLGPIDGLDTLWWNGEFIDSHNVVDNVMFSRFYRIPGNLVKAGPATIALRLLGPRGAFGSPAEFYIQCAEDDTSRVSLAGPWRMREGTKDADLRKGPYPERRGIGAGCFQAMIEPLAPFAIKGVLWYQGEGDVGRPGTYAASLSRMIADWRGLFSTPQLPFYIVQISSFGALADRPVEGSGWAAVREAQADVAAKVPETGLAVSIDRGEIYDIHPPNKQDVAERLARLALEKTYARKIESDSPAYEGSKVEGGAIRVTFRGAGKGLVAKGGVPAAFEIAGADGKYVRAQAVIEGGSVIVSAREVPQPVSVRYGWADHPLCNLYSEAGLPVAPFRTAR